MKTTPLPSWCKSKEAITGGSAGAVAIFLILTFVWPATTDNAEAITELQIEQGIVMTNLDNQDEKLDKLDTKTSIMDSKLNKILIILCQNSDSALCG